MANYFGYWPTPVTLAFAWQECQNGVIFPPMPSLLGTTLDGGTIALTLPFDGIWYITAGISGFETGEWDWGWMARYDNTTPIPVPPASDTDMGGMEGPPSFNLHNKEEGIGEGRGSGRPWCFEVLQ